MTISARDAAVIKGMLRRGDRQNDIAAWFGVNSGRIAEISTGQRWPRVRAKLRDLPPAGPYNVRALYAALEEANAKLGRR